MPSDSLPDDTPSVDILACSAFEPEIVEPNAMFDFRAIDLDFFFTNSSYFNSCL